MREFHLTPEATLDLTWTQRAMRAWAHWHQGYAGKGRAIRLLNYLIRREARKYRAK